MWFGAQSRVLYGSFNKTSNSGNENCGTQGSDAAPPSTFENTTVAFDTSTLLYLPDPASNLDALRKLAPGIKIIFPETVHRELDRHSKKHTDKSVQCRARAINRWLDGALHRGDSEQWIHKETLAETREAERRYLRPSMKNPDDYILACALMIQDDLQKKHSEGSKRQKLLLATDDAHLRASARAEKIDTIRAKELLGSSRAKSKRSARVEKTKEEGTANFSKARYLYRTEVYEKMGVAAGDLVSNASFKGYSRISDAALLRNYPTDEKRKQYKKYRVLMSKTLDLPPLVRQMDGNFKKLVVKSPNGKILIQGEKRQKEGGVGTVISKPDEAEAAVKEEKIMKDKKSDNVSSPPAEERNANVEGEKKKGRLVFETKVYLKMGFDPEEDLVAVPGHSNYSALSDAAVKKGYLRRQHLHERTKTAIELKCPPLKILSDGSTKVVKPKFRVDRADLLFRDEVYAKMDFTSKDLLPVAKHPGYSELKPEVFDLEMSRPRKKDEMSFYSRRRAAAIELNMPPVKEVGAGRSISPASSAGSSASGTE